SVRKVENKVRVTVQLLDVQGQKHLWSQDYDRELKDLFVIQSDIAQKVAEALKVQLMAGEKQQIEKKGTENLEAYTLYLKGRYYENEYTSEGLKNGVEYFERAIKKDPNYVQAYVSLANTSCILGFYNVQPPKTLILKARDAAVKALEIDNTLAEGYTSLGLIKLLHDWDWSGAESAFKQALERNPNYAPVHQWYTWYLSAMGRHDEAIAEIQKALELDPLSLIINRDVGLTLYFARRYDPAIEQYRKTLEMDPNFNVAYWGLGLAYLQKKMYEEAIPAFQKARSPGVLGYAYALSGKKDEAQKVLSHLKEQLKQRYVQSYFLAVIYAGLDEKDQAFQWLQKAYEERSPYLIWLQVDPLYD
ncbi:MAG: tetratricopeptide repeat protein, partial [Nitrospira sp.]|nr:tetratricopeptide repeat protein [Nitrospira sp.]